MASKRLAARSAPASSGTSSPAWNLVLFSAALVAGLSLLISRGRVTWPPGDLLTSAYTLTGCLALIGPIVLYRRGSNDGGVGEMIWMTGGVLIWVFDLAALSRGEGNMMAWATPLGSRTMGLVILAVLVAAWRSSRSDQRSWTWTNVTGWLLGAFWIGLGAAALMPGNPVKLARL